MGTDAINRNTSYTPISMGQNDSVDGPQGASTTATQSAPPQSPTETGPGNELPYDMARVDGVDWDKLTGDLAAGANLSVSITQIETLMIEVLSQMRQDQREAALADAQSALASGLAAAEKMKDAAVANLTATLISSSVDILTSGAALRVGSKGASEGTIRSISGLGQGLSQIAGSVSRFSAETSSAEAKAYEAQAQYEASRQQSDQAYFDQLGQDIKAVQESWKSTESATHQATQAIYSV